MKGDIIKSSFTSNIKSVIFIMKYCYELRLFLENKIFLLKIIIVLIALLYLILLIIIQLFKILYILYV